MKVYFNESIIKEYKRERIPFLYPILGRPKGMLTDNTWFYDKKQTIKWETIWKEYLIYEKNIEDCDYVVFPIDFKIDYLERLEKVWKEAKKYDKKVVLFYYNDCEQPIPDRYNNLIVFRTSLTKKNPPNEFAMPWFPEDLGLEYGIYNWDLKLSIWYVWYAWYHNLLTFIKYLMIRIKLCIFDNFAFYKILLYSKILPKIALFLWKLWMIKDIQIFKNSLLYYITVKWKGLFYRDKLISEVKKTNIKFNYIQRDKMLDNKTTSKLRKQYIDNLRESLFPIIVRWDGNYSYRLYEAMSLWKIPIFIDTDSVLPLSDEIDYKKIFIYVPLENIGKLESLVYNYLDQNGGDLLDIQLKVREIYASKLTLTWFFLTIIKNLSESI